MENVKHKWLRLTKKGAKAILFYLFFLTVVSLILLLWILIDEVNPLKSLSIFSFSILSSIVTSLLGSGISYSRKVYKACISLDMIEPADRNDEIRQLGIFAYYLLRPLYAASLSVIACIVLKSGTEFITKDGGINANFPFIVMIISFFVGYSSSDFIDSLEIKGRKIVQGVFKDDIISQNP